MRPEELKRRLAEMLDLPADVTLELPRILLMGPLQLAIENHRGLIEYTGDRITVGVPKGQVTVEGEELVIGTITNEEITVLGRIRALRFEE